MQEEHMLSLVAARYDLQSPLEVDLLDPAQILFGYLRPKEYPIGIASATMRWPMWTSYRCQT